jgi:hypothetical protein
VYVNIINGGLGVCGIVHNSRAQPPQPHFFVGKGSKANRYFGPGVGFGSLNLPCGRPNLGHNTRSVFDLQEGGPYPVSVGVVPKGELGNTDRGQIDPWSSE